MTNVAGPLPACHLLASRNLSAPFSHPGLVKPCLSRLLAVAVSMPAPRQADHQRPWKLGPEISVCKAFASRPGGDCGNYWASHALTQRGSCLSATDVHEPGAGIVQVERSRQDELRLWNGPGACHVDSLDHRARHVPLCSTITGGKAAQRAGLPYKRMIPPSLGRPRVAF